MDVVQQSDNDKRLYKYIKLSNGLRALLISDPETRIDGSSNEVQEAESEQCSGSESGSEEDESVEEDGHTEPEEQEQHEKRAAAALAVGTGSFSDPLEVQGLSHYLEHMLFMGSEKFPDENEYDSYLARHGGSSNAFTEMEFTNFHFNVMPHRLHGALSRFAQFFVAPLCKAEALEREVQAVNNEFIGVQQSDSCRLAQLRCHTAREGHMYRKFTWGNRKSLIEQPAESGVDVRQKLLDYYRAEYSAERMTLAVLGGDSLDILQQWVEQVFSAIPSGNGAKQSFKGLPFPYEGSQIYILPATKQGHELVASFQLPSLMEAYLAKAEDYLSNLIGHEGQGSLLSALKARGWATRLSAGVSEGGYERNTACFIFEVSIVLTGAGLKAGPGLGLAVMELLFAYLSMLRAKGPQQWLYQELADIGAMKARFLEEDDPMDYVTGVAANMLHVQPPHTLLSDFLYEDWQPDLVTTLLQEMIPSRVRIDLQASDFEALNEDCRKLPQASECREPWFDLPYVSASVPDELLVKWEAASSQQAQELHLPPRNKFIPQDFSLRCDDHVPGEDKRKAGHYKRQKQARPHQCSISKMSPGRSSRDVNNGIQTQRTQGHREQGSLELHNPPTVAAEESGLRLWHKLDTTFRVPRTSAFFVLATLDSYSSPRAAAATQLALKLLHDALNETMYMADIADLQYDMWLEGRPGIQFRVDGFSDKLPLLTQTVFQSLADFKIPEDIFGRVKEVLERRYKNENLNVERHATYTRLRALKQLWDVDDILAELQNLEQAQAESQIRSSLQKLHIEALMEGNITATEATGLLQNIRQALQPEALPAARRLTEQIARLPEGSSYLIRHKAKLAEEENSAVEIYFQCGINELHQRARLDLLEQIASEPCFNTLRTKEQLGYSVGCGIRLTHNVLGFVFTLLSGSHAPSHLDARVTAFLVAFEKELESLPEEEFERNREALIAAKLQKDRSLQELAERHWEQVVNREYRFRAREEEAEVLRGMSKASILECYRRFLAPSSARCARLAVHICGKQHQAEAQAPPPQGVTLVTDPEELRSSLDMHPAPQYLSPRTG